MELAFDKREFRDVCATSVLAQRQFGARLAHSLQARLADLSAIAVVSEVFNLPGRSRELKEPRQGTIVMNLTNDHWLAFISGHIKPRLLPTKAVDWSKVRRIRILGIENGH